MEAVPIIIFVSLITFIVWGIVHISRSDPDYESPQEKHRKLQEEKIKLQYEKLQFEREKLAAKRTRRL